MIADPEVDQAAGSATVESIANLELLAIVENLEWIFETSPEVARGLLATVALTLLFEKVSTEKMIGSVEVSLQSSP